MQSLLLYREWGAQINSRKRKVELMLLPKVKSDKVRGTENIDNK